MDSSSGYGGAISTPADEIGIGAPRTYDWDSYDGSIEFDMTANMLTAMWAWVFDRGTERNIQFSVRKDNVQNFTEAFWNSITITSSEQSIVTGSIGFVAMDREDYDYGEIGSAGYINNKTGAGLLCSGGTFPAPLNPSGSSLLPIPFWKTKVTLDGEVFDFVNWTLTISQTVTKIFACNNTANPAAPAIVGIGPMTATLSGDWVWYGSTMPTAMPGNTIATARIDIGSLNLQMKKLELDKNADNLSVDESMVPINVEYSIFELTPPV